VRNSRKHNNYSNSDMDRDGVTEAKKTKSSIVLRVRRNIERIKRAGKELDERR